MLADSETLGLSQCIRLSGSRRIVGQGGHPASPGTRKYRVRWDLQFSAAADSVFLDDPASYTSQLVPRNQRPQAGTAGARVPPWLRARVLQEFLGGIRRSGTAQGTTSWPARTAR